MATSVASTAASRRSGGVRRAALNPVGAVDGEVTTGEHQRLMSVVELHGVRRCAVLAPHLDDLAVPVHRPDGPAVNGDPVALLRSHGIASLDPGYDRSGPEGMARTRVVRRRALRRAQRPTAFPVSAPGGACGGRATG